MIILIIILLLVLVIKLMNIIQILNPVIIRVYITYFNIRYII
jgi:hypothetical protein